MYCSLYFASYIRSPCLSRLSAVASDDGMKAGLLAEGVTLVDLAAVKLTF